MSDMTFYEQFMLAAEIVAGRHWRYTEKRDDYIKPYEGRAWFNREYLKHRLHPAIEELIRDYKKRPADWHQLLLEWPHRAETDANRVAYTRDERAGIDDRQTLTTLGKYITRHFPDLESHTIRDIVARYTCAGDIEIRRSMGAIVEAATRGPTSCMSHEINVECDDGFTRHPYQVYDPKYGWAIAVRVNGNAIDGRALVWEMPDGGARGFVRSYKRCHNGGYSYADEAIEAWLKAQGYDKWSSWPVEASMAYYPAKNSFLAPYIDGDEQNVTVSRHSQTFYVDYEGEHDCSQTDGMADERGEQCEDCGQHHSDDDVYWVGVYEDRRVGPCCIDDYRYAYGRRGNQYYQHENDCVYVDSQDEWYDGDYLDDNNIVELHNGDYEHIDNAVEVDGDWYESDDDAICYDNYNECYQLVANCTETEDMGMVHDDDVWYCEATLDWYSNAIEYVEVDGKLYHPDHAPESAQMTLLDNNTGE